MVENGEYSHLKLNSWPFHVVPDDETIKIWAGREDLKKNIYRNLKKASRSPVSRVTLLWAWFGSGKSHTLRNLEWICSSDNKYSLYSVYIVFPGQVSNVLDLHKAIVSCLGIIEIFSIEERTVIKAINEFCKPPWNTFLLKAFNYIKYGSQNAKSTILSWISGEKVHLNILKSYEISKRIESIEDCVEVLSSLFKIILSIKKKKAILLMIDEFQEIGQLPINRRKDINGFIHKLFDTNPNALSLYLSFTTGDKDTVRSLLGDALQNRISNFVEIPEMNRKEAYEFLEKLIEIHASPNNPGLFPFVKSGIESIVDHVANSEKFLIPRELIKAADKVLSEADILIEDGDLKEIDGEFVKNELFNNNLDSE